MKKLLIILFFVCIFSFNSCDILRFSLFEVVSWTPGNGYHSEAENIIVSLNFSNKPDRTSIERNFSLTGNGNRVRGNFIWKGNRFTFLPLIPFEKNTDYTLSITADARNTDGLSLDESFNRDFSTKEKSERPALLSFYPSMYAEIDDARTQVRLEFSESMTLNSLYENISFIPSMTGYWTLEDDEKIAVFTPSETWTNNTRYEIRVSSSLTDSGGNNMRNDFTSIFTIGSDKTLPSLLRAYRITKNSEFIHLTPDRGYSSVTEQPFENSGWEKDDRLSLVFSKPVDSLTVKNNLFAEDGQNLIMEISPDFCAELIFKFEKIPVYKSRFTIRLKPGIKDRAGNQTKNESIFRILADGKYSKPPELAGIKIPLSPKSISGFNPVFYEIDSLYQEINITDDDYPSGESVDTWIEFYFSTAENASIDIFSIMEIFRIDTSNNVIDFLPRHVKTNNFKFSQPHKGWEKFQRIEISGNLINKTNSGIINFYIASGLKDSLGNQNEKSFCISIIK